MICPKCGFEQPPAPECARCRVIVAKVRPPGLRGPAAGAVEAPPTEPAASSRRGLRAAVAVLLAGAVGGGAYGLWRWQSARKAPEPTRAASAPVQAAEPDEAAPAEAVVNPSVDAEAPPPGPPAAPRVAPALVPRRAPAPAPADPRACEPFEGEVAAGTDRRATALQPSWRMGADGYEEAAREQRTTGAPMLVYAYTDWCGACRRLERGILDTAEAANLLADYVKARLNPEKGMAERSIANGFGVRGYPSVFVIPAPGAPPRRLSAYRGGELLSPAEYRASIERVIAAEARRITRRGFDLQRSGDLDGALAEIDRALALGGRQALAFYWRGVVRQRRGEIEKAIADVRTAAAIDPRYIAAYDYLAQLASRRSCWEAAVKYYTFVAELSSGERKARALFARGGAFYRRGDLASARHDTGRACELGHGEACRKALDLRGTR